MPKSDDRETAPKAKSEKAKLQTTFLTQYDQSKLLAVAPDILSGESVKKKVLKAIDDAPMFGFPLPDSKQMMRNPEEALSHQSSR